jgi:hypothetical protein
MVKFKETSKFFLKYLKRILCSILFILIFVLIEYGKFI